MAVIESFDRESVTRLVRDALAALKRAESVSKSLRDEKKNATIAICRILAYHGVAGYDYSRDNGLDGATCAVLLRPFIPSNYLDKTGVLVAPCRGYFSRWIEHLERNELPPRVKRNESPADELRKILRAYARKSPAHAATLDSWRNGTLSLNLDI